ncbi:peptidoglycan DD-metalloendopeptidase family protein [Mesorhizobium sp. KR9-304]|uniref:peptidoglycan DD-metalloendopeptidase family protein n=1 Tax=Mesorhizobium sp. KR9-304 TaxID=3156614 RepID=UPI0032B614FE
MQVSVLKRSGLKLSQGAAVFLLAGMAAGCSSQVARFGGVDDFMTASTPNQREIIRPSGDTSGAQTYPGDTQQVAAAPANGAYSGSVSRGALAPVSTAPAAQPVRTASAPAMQPADTTTTGTVKPEPAMAEQGDIKGWSRAGGTQVTVKQGETVYNLSRRFGVPADVIMKSNGLSESDGLKAGAKIVIPTYVYSDKAGVSAPDNNPKTAKAKSSRGEQQPSDPNQDAQQNLAVLPQTPKSKEKSAAATTATADSSNAKPSGASGTYKVQEGDTLSRIARNTGVGVAAIKEANGLSDGLIRVGQTLKIPGAGGSTKVASAAPAATDAVVTNTTKTAETAKPAAQGEKVAVYTPPKKAEKVIEQADETAPDATGIGRMRWPVLGRVISQYGKGSGKSNDGIDISVPEGTPVKAAENGVVIYAGDGLKEFGNTVLVRHEDGLVTVYGHASELKVNRGDKVKRGQDIAVSGMSGTTDAPKLHFEVRKNSAPVDPSTYLE